MNEILIKAGLVFIVAVFIIAAIYMSGRGPREP